MKGQGGYPSPRRSDRPEGNVALVGYRSGGSCGHAFTICAIVPVMVENASKEIAREKLRYAAAALHSHDAVREALQRERDAALVAAREAGVTWVEMQSDSGLTVGAVRSALSRAQN